MATPTQEHAAGSIVYQTPVITSIGGRDGTVRSADGQLDLQVGLPKEMGGAGGKTNPEELFAAGYAACFHSALKRVAAEKKSTIGKSSVETQVAIGPNASGGYQLSVKHHVILPEADVEEATAIVKGAHALCPYSNATRNNIEVKLSVTPSDGTEHDVD